MIARVPDFLAEDAVFTGPEDLCDLVPEGFQTAPMERAAAVALPQGVPVVCLGEASSELRQQAAELPRSQE